MTNENDTPQLTRGQWEMQEIINVAIDIIKADKKFAEAKKDYDGGHIILNSRLRTDPAIFEQSVQAYMKHMCNKYLLPKVAKLMKQLSSEGIIHIGNSSQYSKPNTAVNLNTIINSIYPSVAIELIGEEAFKKVVEKHFLALSNKP